MKNRSIVKAMWTICVMGLLNSCMGLQDTTPPETLMPEIQSFDVYSEDGYIFELSAILSKEDAARIVECGFYVSDYKTMQGAEKIVSKLLGQEFIAEFSLTEEGEKKHVCAYLSVGEGHIEICSEVKTIVAGESLSENESLLIDVLKFPDDTQAHLSGVVAAVTRRGFLLSDKYANMLYVYAGNGWERNVEVGNTVNVIGNVATYYNNRELMMESVVVTGTSFVPTSDAIRLTSSNLSEFASAGHHPCKIEVTGELIYDSPFYEIVVGSSPVVVGLTFPIGDMTSYVGKTIKLTGYYLWTSISPSSETVVSIVDTNITII